MDPNATVMPKEQPELPILEHGIVINPVDTDVVVDLRLEYKDGNMSTEEFEQRLDEITWI